MNAATPPTSENVAEMLSSGDNDYHDGNHWSPSIFRFKNVLHLKITPFSEDGDELPIEQFTAVISEGEQAPIVLEQPAELGLQWDDGSDLLALDSHGIMFTLRGIDSWDMDAAGARELAAQLAAMADAHEAALAEQSAAPREPARDLPQISVACPTCQAQPGELCTSHSGTRVRRTDTHQARTRAWKDSTPAYPAPGSEIPDQPGYVVGTCTHRVAACEWRAGFRTCERCPGKAVAQ